MGCLGQIPSSRASLLRSGAETRRGVAELLQGGRVIAISDTKPRLLSFAAINKLPVINYTDKPGLAVPEPAQVPVFCLD